MINTADILETINMIRQEKFPEPPRHKGKHEEDKHIFKIFPGFFQENRAVGMGSHVPEHP